MDEESLVTLAKEDRLAIRAAVVDVVVHSPLPDERVSARVRHIQNLRGLSLDCTVGSTRK